VNSGFSAHVGWTRKETGFRTCDQETRLSLAGSAAFKHAFPRTVTFVAARTR
jgi:hypothetical protein